MRYKIPNEYAFRLHHARPRFKSDVESVLLFVCQRISNLEKQSSSLYDAELFKMIRAYPGNFEKAEKTIHNWRTEISALFGLIETTGDYSAPGFYAKLLARNEDLIEFFRYFLFTFQYPGGHIKPQKVAEQIEAGIDFHPTKFIIQLFFEGQKILGDDKQFSISSAELTALVFNDLRVTATKSRDARFVANLMLENRKHRVEYDQTGDVVRYAQDILDYMVLADILNKRVNTNTYHFKNQGLEAALKIVQRAPSFEGYRHLYGLGKPDASEVSSLEDDWMRFVNQDRISEAFVGDILSILEVEDSENSIEVDGLIESLRRALEGDARDIGRAGESVVLTHEVTRLNRLNRPELSKKVKKIPDHLGVGYDIFSFEGLSQTEFAELNRFIEVKATRSKRQLVANSFTLTPNEWNAARSHGDTYYVYRLIISEGALRMFVINNPYEQERKGNLSMSPRNGAEITYTEAAGTWEDVLIPRLRAGA
ncbi:Restriction endonuclease, type II, BpuJI, N-terminal [Candidatus Nanopelagicaceae bacterium]